MVELTPEQKREWEALELADRNPELAQRPRFDELVGQMTADAKTHEPAKEVERSRTGLTKEQQRQWHLLELGDVRTDWEVVTSSPQFVHWAQSGDLERRRRFFSDDSRDVLELIDEFERSQRV